MFHVSKPTTLVARALVLTALGCSVCACSSDAQRESHARKQAAQLSPDDAKSIGTEAYIYAYPLVTMEMTRRVSTNVAKPEGKYAPVGQFARLREYPDASFRDVTAPNADTLYTVAWLDLAREPWVLSLPASDGRYYLMPMLDGWTTVFDVPGTRTTGDGAGQYAIVGPKWRGKLPAGVKEYRSATDMVWVLGRIYCTGTPEDYKLTHAMQDKVTVVPLSSYGKPYTPPPAKVDPSVRSKPGVRDQVDGMSAAEYFKTFAELLKTNPPTKDDGPMVKKLAKLGIVPGEGWDVSFLDPAAAKALEEVPKAAVGKIMASFKTAGKRENGWVFTTKTGIYGTDYLNRALITAIGLGANRPQDAVYPTSETDADGKPYSGASKYVMRFEKGQMPPAEAFWSLTMYNAEYFFVDNPLNRYNVSSRSKFKTNPDGSTDVYIQNENPGPDKESNWLPAPKDRFVLMLRLYHPRETSPSLINGSWAIPPVKKVQ
jgi:hypothetical protein